MKRKRIISIVLICIMFMSMLPLNVNNIKAAESWLWPAKDCYTVSSNYGLRDLYGTGSFSNKHYGIDIVGSSSTLGKAVYASKSGTVYESCNTIADNTFINNSCGNYVAINHGDGTYSIYMHLRPNGVKTSGSVRQGDIIGYIGNTGHSYGAHLHFQIYTNPSNRNGTTLNPMPTNSNISIRNQYVLPSGWSSEKTTYFFENPISTSLSISGENVPGDINLGGVFSIKGTVTSSNNITKVTVGCYDSSGNMRTGASAEPNTKSYNIANLDSQVRFNDLSIGTYTYKVIATDTAETKTLVSSTFKILGTGSTSTAINPEGCLDSVAGGNGTITVSGWAFDRNDVNASLEIHVYVGGTYSDGKAVFGTQIKADKLRTDVNNVHGTGEYHGFSDTITVPVVGTYPVYVYAINVGGRVGTNYNTLLGNKTVTITGDKDGPTISNIKVEKDELGYSVTCDVSDEAGIDHVQFPSWTAYNDQDDLVGSDGSWPSLECHRGTVSNGKAAFRVNRSDHKNEYGVYYTHIYAYDTYGNVTCEQIVVELEEQHTYESIVTKAATCTENGTKTYRCECGNSYTEPINALGHELGTWEVQNEESCTVTGLKVKNCNRAGCDYTESQTIDATGHVYNDWKVVEEATTTKKGLKARECSYCGEQEIEIIAKLDDQPSVQINPFKDVSEKAYYYNAVLWALENKITSGLAYDTFAPDFDCTRAEVVTFLWRANGCPEPNMSWSAFKDVPDNAYYSKAVRWATENGITSGYNSEIFGSNDKVTRCQFVTFLWRMEGRPEPFRSEKGFSDITSKAYYYKAVLWAVESGITAGYYQDMFAPDMSCTRCQVVSFLYRAYE